MGNNTQTDFIERLRGYDVWYFADKQAKACILEDAVTGEKYTIWVRTGAEIKGPLLDHCRNKIAEQWGSQ